MTNDVTFQREEVDHWTPRWKKIDDVVAGEYAVKKAGDAYLPRPNPTDESDQNLARYDQYVQRAVFFNATGRTLEGLVGIAYRRQPEIEIPSSMEFVRTDIDGAGGGLVNQSHRVLEDTFRHGRAALLVDFPIANETISLAQLQAGRIHATITAYKANQIINWRINQNQDLSLVVLYEQLEDEDGYATKIIEQWRELALGTLSTEDDDAPVRYVVRIWRRGGAEGSGRPEIVEEYEPKDARGKPWEFIPFTFVGAMDNNAEVDKPPLEDLANLNLAHYRNSAEFEESTFFVGQPTIVFTGLDDQWVKDMQDMGVYVGSREAIPLPEGANAMMLQAKENTAAERGMEMKERQMVATGARLLTHGEAIKTAEQSRSETAAAHSVLSLVCDNVSSAYVLALSWALLFTQAGDGDVNFTIPTDFTGLSADPTLLSALVAGWQGGALPRSDLFAALRQLGVIDPEKTDQEILDELELEGGGLNLEP
jgi:hypothetical protein